ncbi:hypothetical protein Nepgr_031329 [Nepenthes gracilis]|uniref:Uncharacterized protein n=1 Tax=Nepenthes gracilis TaxID=150966 RepID=A0AAD3THW7_NEPGR|nr:hypothetical protein Nepgr_031329 [Nepenthes gracilis]
MAAGPFGYCDPIEGFVCCYLESTGYCGLMDLGFPTSAAALFLIGMQCWIVVCCINGPEVPALFDVVGSAEVYVDMKLWTNWLLGCWQHHDSLLKGVEELLKPLLKPSRLQILVAAIRITPLCFQHDAEELTAVGVRLLASPLLLVWAIWGRAVPYLELC